MKTDIVASARAVIERMTARPQLAPSRMPVLNAIMERLGISGTDYMRRLCVPQVMFLFTQLNIAKSVDVLQECSDSVSGVFQVPEWDSQIIIGVDRSFVNTIMEAAFGGDGSEARPGTARGFTPLDIRMARSVIEHLAASFVEQFQSISRISLHLERIEIRLEGQTLGPKPFDVVVAKHLVQSLGSEGRVFFIFPAASLAQSRSLLERASGSNAGLADPAWTRNFEHELARTNVAVQVVLGSLEMTLADVAAFRVGQLIDLQVLPDSPVLLEDSQNQLFNGRLAQSNGRFVVTIESEVVASDHRVPMPADTRRTFGGNEQEELMP